MTTRTTSDYRNAHVRTLRALAVLPRGTATVIDLWQALRTVTIQDVVGALCDLHRDHLVDFTNVPGAPIRLTELGEALTDLGEGVGRGVVYD